MSPALTGRFFTTSATWEALHPSLEGTSNDRKTIATESNDKQCIPQPGLPGRSHQTWGHMQEAMLWGWCCYSVPYKCNHICRIYTSSRCRKAQRYGAMVFVNIDPCFHWENSDENLIFFLIFIYLAASGFSCGMRDLWCSCGIFHCSACGLLVPHKGLNLHPLHCKANLDHQGSLENLS